MRTLLLAVSSVVPLVECCYFECLRPQRRYCLFSVIHSELQCALVRLTKSIYCACVSYLGCQVAASNGLNSFELGFRSREHSSHQLLDDVNTRL